MRAPASVSSRRTRFPCGGTLIFLPRISNPECATAKRKPACPRGAIMLNVTTTKASGARIIAELIHGHGVSHVFFVPAILRDGLAELSSLDVRPVSAHG